MAAPAWVTASFFNGLVLGILLVHQVSIDPNDLRLKVAEEIVRVFEPSLLWTIALAGIVVTIFGAIQLFIFYYGLWQIGIVTTISGLLLFISGIIIVFPEMQGLGATFLIAGILGAILSRVFEYEVA